MQRHSDPPSPLRLDDLFTPEQLAQQYPNVLNVRALRWQLRNRESNGLAAACVRIGKQDFLSRSRYEAWLTRRAGAK
jgi:hypothetical protein